VLTGFQQADMSLLPDRRRASAGTARLQPFPRRASDGLKALWQVCCQSARRGLWCGLKAGVGIVDTLLPSRQAFAAFSPGGFSFYGEMLLITFFISPLTV